MSRQRILFESTGQDGNEKIELEVKEINNQIYISMVEYIDGHEPNLIFANFSRDTAIKIVKQLRREIGKTEVRND